MSNKYKPVLCCVGYNRPNSMERLRDVRREWNESRKCLEELIKKPVNHAALPYGDFISCSYLSMREALHCGYRTVASTMAAPEKGRMLPRYLYHTNVEERINGLMR